MSLIFTFLLYIFFLLLLWGMLFIASLFVIHIDFSNAWCAANAPGCPDGVKNISYTGVYVILFLIGVFLSIYAFMLIFPKKESLEDIQK